MNFNECNLKDCAHRSHRGGTFYMLPDSLPFVLHDQDGCIYITQEHFQDLIQNNIFRISHTKNGDKINIRKGISSLRGYIGCNMADKCPRSRFRNI